MKVFQIVKEYQEDQVEMRGPSQPNAAPVKTGGVTSYLRMEPATMDAAKLLKLFNIAARDFPAVPVDQIRIDRVHQRIEVDAAPPAGKGYVLLPPRSIAVRG